ncbi:MAG: DHH family phosphoesterase [Phycisphaerales bacterium]|nr:DHH family phosphoesterase [Phycisphaerales bacterium]
MNNHTHAAGHSRPPLSTTTPSEIASRLLAAPTSDAPGPVVITTHAKPDGDAAGSSLALARALIHKGVPAEVWHVGPFQGWLKTIAGDTPTRRISQDTPAASLSSALPSDASNEPRAIVVTDTGSWVQLETLTPWLKPRTQRVMVIDHHLQGDADLSPRRLVETTAASATQVLAPVIDALLGLRADEALPEPIARMLYLGLATDTGWFKFSNTSAAAMRLAARMIDSGVDHAGLYQLIDQQDAAVRPRLLGRALSSLRYFDENTIAFMALTGGDLRELSAGQEDTGGFAEPAMSVMSVRVVAVFTDATRAGDAQPTTKVSLRSKPGTNAIDVAAVCASLGGGGHARAAGVKLKMEIPQAQEAVLQALRMKRG